MLYKGELIRPNDLVDVRLRVVEAFDDHLVAMDSMALEAYNLRRGTNGAFPHIVGHRKVPPTEPANGAFVGIVGEQGVVPARSVWKRMGGGVAPWVNAGSTEARTWRWLLDESDNGERLRLMTPQKLQ